MSGRWHIALGFALTGDELDLDVAADGGPGDEPNPERLVTQLEQGGWSRERILEHALSRVTGDLSWPHFVPAELRTGCGAAQFHAALGATRALLDLQVLESRPPSGRTRLSPDEERLLRDVPPHHGV
ncbi:MAG TPA: hypothetical protein PLL50_08175 [Propionicimonas sp.]|nr:hypothetical protein [Propionicimonas sp.]HQA78315.1 hypothetical protein [Propionicimonas sp.]HQD97394.1 hypothetical protein [Propionicimonas sp.]